MENQTRIFDLTLGRAILRLMSLKDQINIKLKQYCCYFFLLKFKLIRWNYNLSLCLSSCRMNGVDVDVDDVFDDFYEWKKKTLIYIHCLEQMSEPTSKPIHFAWPTSVSYIYLPTYIHKSGKKPTHLARYVHI